MNSELPFRPDFAERVLGAADAQIARRRRLRQAGAAAAVLLIGGMVALGTLRPVSAPVSAQQAQIETTASLDITAIEEPQTEPVDYMFPDAGALNAFSESYSSAFSGSYYDDDTGS